MPVSQNEFNKLKKIVIALSENQSKIMNQIIEVEKELKDTIELLHATNENLELQINMNKLSSLNSFNM